MHICMYILDGPSCVCNQMCLRQFFKLCKLGIESNFWDSSLLSPERLSADMLFHSCTLVCASFKMLQHGKFAAPRVTVAVVSSVALCIAIMTMTAIIASISIIITTVSVITVITIVEVLPTRALCASRTRPRSVFALSLSCSGLL